MTPAFRRVPRWAYIILLTGLLVCCMTLPASALAQSITLTSPAPNATMSGTMTFTVSTQQMPTLASVEYVLNGRTFSGPIYTSPYSYQWNTAIYWNGPQSVQAIARDAAGNILAQSSAVAFAILNGSNGTIALTSPNPAQVLSGTVTWSVSGTGVPIDACMFFVDGTLYAVTWGNPTYNLDTTKFCNGTHELYVAAYYNDSGIDMPLGMSLLQATFNNGHLPLQVDANYRDCVLAPNATVTLTPFMYYTDNVTAPLDGCTFSSDTPAVATVNSAGLVTAVTDGVANITITEASGMSLSVRVWVTDVTGLPHFGTDGTILTAYNPSKSSFVGTMFFMAPSEIDNTSGLAANAHAAALNNLTSGFYTNPADDGQPNYASWLAGYTPWVDSIFQTAQNNGFNLVLTGDDFDRTVGELNNSITGSWSPQAIQTAFSDAYNSGCVTCVEMCDEVSMCWGDTPTPTDNRWMGDSPPIPDTAFTTLMSTIDGTGNRNLIGWPIAALSGADAAQNWMGNPNFADYATEYFTLWDWREAYPFAASLPEYRAGLDASVVQRFPYIQREKPQLCEAATCGYFYTKEGPGDQYVPGQDLMQAPPVSPVECAATVMYAAARGMAGVRAYGYDWSFWKYCRANDPVGTTCEQTGCDPVSVDTDTWQAMSTALNLIKRQEPAVLQMPVHAEDLGPSIVTGARSSGTSNLLMATNFMEGSNTQTVNLTPYMYSTPIVRLRQLGATLRTDVIANTSSDTVTFAPGESIWWLCEASAAGVPPAIAFTAPLPNATVAGTITLSVSAAAENGGSLSSVAFYVDGTLLGTVTSAPYTWNWNSTSVTSNIWHSVSAVATDNGGNASEARLAVLVLPNTPDCAAPTFTPAPGLFASAQQVSIGTTTNGATIRYTTDGSTPTETAGTVYSSALTISSNTTLQAIAYASGMNDSPETLGLYLFNPPTVNLTAPSNGAVFTAPATITLSASAGSSDSSISKVQFFNGATLLGTVTSSPYSYTWTNVTNGVYTLTAVATDLWGAQGTSSAAAITVDAAVPPSSGMMLWLKADAITGVNNGGAVSTWPDSSGLGNNATQTTQADQPTFVTGDLNGEPAVRFTSADAQFMNIAAGFNGAMNTLTEIAVLKAPHVYALFQTEPYWGDNLCYDCWTDTISHACDITAYVDDSKIPSGGMVTVICNRDERRPSVDVHLQQWRAFRWAVDRGYQSGLYRQLVSG